MEEEVVEEEAAAQRLMGPSNFKLEQGHIFVDLLSKYLLQTHRILTFVEGPPTGSRNANNRTICN